MQVLVANGIIISWFGMYKAACLKSAYEVRLVTASVIKITMSCGIDHMPRQLLKPKCTCSSCRLHVDNV
jgi:hypothetical protein